MGLFVNLAAAGDFTLQSGAPNWLYYMPGWVFSSFRGVRGTSSSFLSPADCLTGSSCAPMCACVSVGVCGWVGDRGFVSHCSFFHVSLFVAHSWLPSSWSSGPSHCPGLTELRLVIKHLGSILSMKVKLTVGGDSGEGGTTLSGGGDSWWCSVVVAAEVALVLVVRRAGDSEAGSGHWLQCCRQVSNVQSGAGMSG